MPTGGGVKLLILKYKKLKQIDKYLGQRGVGTREYRLIFMVLCVVIFLTVLLLVIDNKSIPNTIEKNEYGRGEVEEELYITWDTKLKDTAINIKVPEKIYTDKEVEAFFNTSKEWINQHILSSQDTPEHVESKLNFVNQIPNTPIQVEWDWYPYEMIDYKGNLNREYISKEGSELEITAILKYKEQCVLYKMGFVLYPKTLDQQEKLVATIIDSIQKQNKGNEYNTYFELPTKVQGKKVLWKKEFNYRGIYILILGVIGAFLIIMQKVEEQKKQQLKLSKEMEREYPEIINTLVLYIGAGMTTKKAWEKIVEDYEKANYYQPAYEQMRITQCEIKNGVLEIEAYLRFADRCNLPSYQKFVLLLVQNIKRGTKGIVNLLEIESQNAFRERLNTARQCGEKAGTKMLLPMFLMLVVVLIVITIPAFLEIQI